MVGGDGAVDGGGSARTGWQPVAGPDGGVAISYSRRQLAKVAVGAGVVIGLFDAVLSLRSSGGAPGSSRDVVDVVVQAGWVFLAVASAIALMQFVLIGSCRIT